MIETFEAIDVFDHTSGSVKNLKEATKKLLSPTANLMDGTVMIQNFFDGTAITKPEELGTPEEFAVLADSPATASSFPNKQMGMTFLFSTAARSKSKGTQPSTIHGQIKSANAIQTEQGKGDGGSIRVVGLHEDPTHGGSNQCRIQPNRS
jgi:hypothetical protein